MKLLRRMREDLIIFLFGGILYSLLEICFRGFTHWSMTLTGGMCFLIMFRHFEGNPDETMMNKCIFGTIIITAFEFAVGCTVNLLCGWNVWDYSAQPLNIMGQVCIAFSALWFLLTIPIAGLCGVFRKKFSASGTM